jgi:hypothetical protein
VILRVFGKLSGGLCDPVPICGAESLSPHHLELTVGSDLWFRTGGEN